MIRASAASSPRTERAARLLAFLLLGLAAAARADSPGCSRARAIVAEVEKMYAAGNADPRAALQKLQTAQQLCPTLGDAWKYAYCSALAAGDEQNARIYKDRAMFNNVADFDCAGIAKGIAPPPKPLPRFVRRKYALIIGVGKFKEQGMDLQFAAKDARDFADVLTDSRYGRFDAKNVTVLTNDLATRSAILDALQTMILQVHEEDLFVLYVSSHGFPSNRGTGLSSVGYIVTYDTSPTKIWDNAIEYSYFAEKYSMIKAGRKVAFLDTCYSGEFSKRGGKALTAEGLSLDEQTAKMFLSGEGSAVVTSSDNNEQSWESDKIQNSYFTHYLIDALKRSAEPASVKDIFDYIKEKVPEAVAHDKQASQHPQMRPATGAGDVRIGVVAQESATPIN